MLWHRMRTLLFYGGDRRSYVSIIRRLASRGACYRHNQSTKMTASADAKNEDQVGYTFSGSGGGGWPSRITRALSPHQRTRVCLPHREGRR